MDWCHQDLKMRLKKLFLGAGFFFAFVYRSVQSAEMIDVSSAKKKEKDQHNSAVNMDEWNNTIGSLKALGGQLQFVPLCSSLILISYSLRILP